MALTLPPITEFVGDYRFLSNFDSAEVTFEGLTYPTVEHAYQAAKTTNLADRERICRCITPGEAKKMKPKTPRGWHEGPALTVMGFLLQQKFAREPFKTKLRHTVGRELVEGNWWGDVYWGKSKGIGENHLGKILMAIRDGTPLPAAPLRQEALF